MEKLGMREYPGSLTDSEWEIIRPLLPDGIAGKAAGALAARDPQRHLLHHPHRWRVAYDAPLENLLPLFRQWAKQGHWERIHHAIRDMARLKPGKKSPDRRGPR